MKILLPFKHWLSAWLTVGSPVELLRTPVSRPYPRPVKPKYLQVGPRQCQVFTNLLRSVQWTAVTEKGCFTRRRQGQSSSMTICPSLLALRVGWVAGLGSTRLARSKTTRHSLEGRSNICSFIPWRVKAATVQRAQNLGKQADGWHYTRWIPWNVTIAWRKDCLTAGFDHELSGMF